MKPKIRFKEFEEEWQKKALAAIATFSKGKGYSKSDLRPNGTPIILYGRMYTDYHFCINTVDTYAALRPNSFLSKGNEIIIPGSGETAEDIACASVVKQRGVVLGGDINIISLFKETNPEFTALSLTYGPSKKMLVKCAQGKTVVHLHNSEISKAKVFYPSEKEQQAIASYFTHLDALINSSAARLSSLKQVKAASLQAMFPQEGEKVPRLRFKGFEGEWKKVAFKDMYEQRSEKNDLSFGEDKIISVANMYFRPISYISTKDYLKSYNVFRLGDIAFEGNKSKNFAHGRFVENTIGDGIVSHVFVVLKRKDNSYDMNFWKYLINDESIMGSILVRCTKSSTMMSDIVVEDFMKESILAPSLEEQKKIGEFLASLDNQIALQSQRLEKLRQIKAACLDKMFV